MARVNIMIDHEQCIGCKRCMDACFQDVLRMDPESKKMTAQYPDECEFCLICEEQCPKDCIRVIPVTPWYIPDPFGEEA